MFSKFVREHAFRHIFSPVEDPAIPRLRPRYINLEMYRNEKAEWAKWAEEQANAELDLSRPLPGGWKPGDETRGKKTGTGRCEEIDFL